MLQNLIAFILVSAFHCHAQPSDYISKLDPKLRAARISLVVQPLKAAEVHPSQTQMQSVGAPRLGGRSASGFG